MNNTSSALFLWDPTSFKNFYTINCKNLYLVDDRSNYEVTVLIFLLLFGITKTVRPPRLYIEGVAEKPDGF
jgi:hypothetical protein